MSLLVPLFAFAFLAGFIPLAAAQEEVPSASPTVLLRIDRSGTIRTLIAKTRDDIRTALRNSRISYEGLTFNQEMVQVRIAEQDIERAKETLAFVTHPLSPESQVRLFFVNERQPGMLVFLRNEAGVEEYFSTLTSKAVAVLERRVDELLERGFVDRLKSDFLGGSGVVIEKQGNDRILVQIAGAKDVKRLEKFISSTARLSFQMVDQSMSVEDAIKGQPPTGSVVMYSTGDSPTRYLVQTWVVVSGDHIVDAQAIFDARTSEPAVSIRFDKRGTALFGVATQRNVGRLVAIILDNQLIAAPQIREPILGGAVQIAGNFSVVDAKDLAALLRAGPLPADFIVIRSR